MASSISLFVLCVFASAVLGAPELGFFGHHNASGVDLKELAQKIIGGSTASHGQFPYQVSLQQAGWQGYQHFCGGSIISEYWVVTAAHCTQGSYPGAFVVVAGEYSLSMNDGSEQMVEVSQIIVHEAFNGQIFRNDISLIRLASPLQFNTYVQPIGLAQSGPSANDYCTLSGWGSYVQSTNPILPDKLNYVQLPTVDLNTCNSIWAQYIPVSNTQVCTGPLQGGQSPCNGDSGGPLVCGGMLSGIVSFGQIPCGQAYWPSVFTRVSSFVNWVSMYAN